MIVIAGAALAQAPPILTPEPAFTAGYTNTLKWSPPPSVPGITTAWEIWVMQTESGMPDWPDIPDTLGPAHISIFMMEDVAEDWGDTFGVPYAYPVGSGDLGPADDPLVSGVRYCYKVRYRWLDGPSYGFSPWSITYCSTQDAAPPSAWINTIPTWTSTSICSLNYRVQDYVCLGIDSAVLYYKANIGDDWVRYGRNVPALAADTIVYYEGRFIFDSDVAWGDGEYYFYVAGWDSLGNGIVPGVGTHYHMAWTRIDDEDPSSMIDTIPLPLYYNGWPGGIDIRFTGSDTYSGVYAAYLDTDHGTGHSHFIDTLFFYGRMDVDSFFSFTPTVNGVYNLRSTLQDSAGNIERKTGWDWVINVDTEIPTFNGVVVVDTTTISHRYDVPAMTGWTNETVVRVQALSPNDPPRDSYASGIATLEAASNSSFTADLDDFTFGAEPYFWTSAPGPDGIRDAYLRLIDRAGNVSNQRQGQIKLDTQAPMLFSPIELRNRLTPGMSSDTTTSLTVDVIANVDPAGGTVSGIYFTQNIANLNSIGEADWLPISGSYTYTFTGFSNLDWMTLYAVVRDSAGNVSVDARDSIRYVTGNKFVEILRMKDIDGPDTTGRYTDTTLVEITIRYGDGIDSILVWDGSSMLTPPDTFFWVPDPPGADTVVTIYGVLDRIDGWHTITVRGAAEYGGGIYTAPDTAAIELDIQPPRIGIFNVVDISTALEPSIPADVADTGWTNNRLVKASFLNPTDSGGDPLHPGTGIYHYKLTLGDTLMLDTGGFPTPHIVNFNLPEPQGTYEVWGSIQDSAGNWSSEIIPDAFGVTLDTHIPVLDSIQLWDNEMSSMSYTDDPEIVVKSFGHDGVREPYYIAIFENLGAYPGEIRVRRMRYHEVGNSYTLTDTSTGGIKTVYAAFMDRAGNISSVAQNQIVYNKRMDLQLTLYDTDSDPRNTECTNERNVSAILHVPSGSTPAAKYILTETLGVDPLPTDPRWFDYSETVSHTLSEGEGEKIVYGWLLSVSLIVSPMDVDTIYLDQTAPEMVEGFEIWDTTSADNFPTVFQAALGWSNEPYVFAQIPDAWDAGCGTDSMRFSGGIDLSLWQAMDYNIDADEGAVSLAFRTDSIPLIMDTDSEGRKDITAKLRDSAGNWGNPFDPNSMITINGGYDTQPPDFHFLDFYDTTMTDSITTPRPSYLPIHFVDDPAPGFLWKVCWQVLGNTHCTVYDDSWDTDNPEIFFAAFPTELAEILIPDVHYALNVVAIDSAGNPSEMKTADLLVIPDTISFGFTVVDSNDTDDAEYCGELTVMTKIDIANPPTEMRFGESPTGLGSWMPYTQEGYFRLGSSVNGMKFVYAQVRFGTSTSKIEVDSIILDTQPPTVGNIIAFDLETGDPNYTENFIIGLKATGCSDNYTIGSIFIAEDPAFTVNAVRCDFDSITAGGSIGWTTYEVSREPYIPEGLEPSGAIRQDARRFWAKLLDRAENAAVQIKQPSIVIDLDELTISNFPNPFNPDIEPTFIRVKGIGAGESVEVSVYDNYGNLVWRTTKAAEPNSKALDILWDGKNGQGDKIASGVYIAVVESGGEIFKRKIAVWKGGE